MASCKECIQYDVCESADDVEYPDEELLKSDCPRFKNKANFVEVVLCKDCKHWGKFDDKYRTDGHCRELTNRHGAEMWATEGDHFCSYGERKENK